MVACLGIALSAACGFRVFLPMLIGSIACRFGFWEASAEWEWVSSWPAIALFAIATVVEIAAYYVPWLDNLLDSISAPCSLIAGLFIAAACFADWNPWLQWSLAAIAGGGSATVISLGLSGIRLGSTILTGGLANPLLATFEWIMATLLALMAVVLPVLAAIIAIILVVLMIRFAVRASARFRAKATSKAKLPE